MKKNIFFLIMISFVALAVFIIINAGITYKLQEKLIIFVKLGSYAHWATIFLLLPLISGLLLRLFNIPYRLLIIPVGATISALFLYPQYRDFFWLDPPHPLVAVYYAICVTGIAILPNINFIRIGRILKSAKRVKSVAARKNIEKTKTKDTIPVSNHKNKISQEIKSRLEYQTDSAVKPEYRLLPGIFESPKYAGLLATLQLLIALFSLLLSAISIIVLGSK